MPWLMRLAAVAVALACFFASLSIWSASEVSAEFGGGHRAAGDFVLALVPAIAGLAVLVGGLAKAKRASRGSGPAPGAEMLRRRHWQR